MRVASKVNATYILNLPSKCGHARPLGSRIIPYVRDGRTDRRLDGQKQRLFPLPYGRGIINCLNDCLCKLEEVKTVNLSDLNSDNVWGYDRACVQ